MVEVECTTARPGGVTLVAVRLDNRVEAAGVDAHRVRLAPRLDGPIWPPRVEGVPAGPWEFSDDVAAVDDATSRPTVDVVVPTGRVGSVGFASPAEPVDPPVEVVEVAPADAAAEVDPSAADVLRVLGDPAPPRDVVAEDVGGRAKADGDGGPGGDRPPDPTGDRQ